MTTMDKEELIYDWNTAEGAAEALRAIQFDDETLRDGLQSPSARDPELADKVRLVHLMDQLGIHTADIGLPGAGARAREHILTLCREMDGLAITPNVACRTLVSDIAPVVDVVQETGTPVEVCAFIGSSPIRQFAENWELDTMLGLVRDAVGFCTENDLPCMFVTEDTTRAHPEDVRKLYTTAIEAGARRICVCDTVGHSTPWGVRSLIGFVRKLVDELGADVGIDWHGHRDRGLGLVNALEAVRAGVTRVHATALGVGERAGNTEMDLLLVNLRLAGMIDNDLSALSEYCQLASDSIGVPLPYNYPVFGKDAFETATGVHAAAVIKAFKKGDAWLANRVYSGVPADMVGLEQAITVGPMSGRSNVIYFLEKRGVEPTDDAVGKVLELAKTTPRLLTEDEILAAAGA
jgi:2-isopropylmalate synthase